MQLVIQRVSHASVTVDGEIVGEIGEGILALVGIGTDDTEDSVRKGAQKLAKLRIFPDDPDVSTAPKDINRSVRDIGGAVLAVSQFTLLADTSAGNRPGFVNAAPPETAEPLFTAFVKELQSIGVPVETGEFGAYMDVSLINTGPVTILHES